MGSFPETQNDPTFDGLTLHHNFDQFKLKASQRPRTLLTFPLDISRTMQSPFAFQDDNRSPVWDVGLISSEISCCCPTEYLSADKKTQTRQVQKRNEVPKLTKLISPSPQVIGPTNSKQYI